MPFAQPPRHDGELQVGIRMGQVGLAQKLLIPALIFGIVVQLLPPLLSDALPLLQGALFCLAIALQWYAVFKLLKALYARILIRVAWLALMVVPLFNLIGLFILNRRATRLLRAAGYKVGFWGVDLRELSVHD